MWQRGVFIVEANVHDGILADLARVRAMWMGDIRDLWCGGDKVRCTRVVQDLVDRKLVEVRRGHSDARRRYVVLTATGAGAAGLDEKRRGSRTSAVVGERLADYGAFFAEFVRNGVRREDVLVGQELRHRARLPRQFRPMVGLLRGPRLTAIVLAPLSWKRWRRLLEHASGISEWVFLSRDNRTWSCQLDAWVKGRCGTPTWIPKPTWSVARLLDWLDDRDRARAVPLQDLGLVFAPGRRGRRRTSDEQQSWCYVQGRLCVLEDFRGFPVHRLCVLADPARVTGEGPGCSGVVAFVETRRDAARLAKYLGPGAPWLFLVGGDRAQLLRPEGRELVPIAGGVGP